MPKPTIVSPFIHCLLMVLPMFDAIFEKYENIIDSPRFGVKVIYKKRMLLLLVVRY